MPNYNECHLIGHVGQKPEIKALAGGKTVATFSLATTDGTGENKRTQWHKVTAWERLSELCANYIDKGTPVMVVGRISYREYEKDGVKKNLTEIIANKIVLLGSGGGKAKTTASGDEVPF